LPILILPNLTAAPGRREGPVAILTKSNALDGQNLTNSRRHLVLNFGPGGSCIFILPHLTAALYHSSLRSLTPSSTTLHGTYASSQIHVPILTAALYPSLRLHFGGVGRFWCYPDYISNTYSRMLLATLTISLKSCLPNLTAATPVANADGACGCHR
jgi:hypothetical protein